MVYKIVKKQTLNQAVELMEIHAPYVARKCEPGQFIIIRVDEDGERVPLTIADYDREKETVTIIYQGCRIYNRIVKQESRRRLCTGFRGTIRSASSFAQV